MLPRCPQTLWREKLGSFLAQEWWDPSLLVPVGRFVLS